MEAREKDLFETPVAPAPAEHSVPPSESVFVDLGGETLEYVGEVQIPRPVPPELVVEIDGWDYVYKLDRRAKSEALDTRGRE